MITTADVKKFFSERRESSFGWKAIRWSYLPLRICRGAEPQGSDLPKWQGYPESRKEFEGLQSFRTHDLDLLLRLGGREQVIKTSYFAEWSAVAQWNPESRYQPVGKATAADAQLMIQAAELLLRKYEGHRRAPTN